LHSSAAGQQLCVLQQLHEEVMPKKLHNMYGSDIKPSILYQSSHLLSSNCAHLDKCAEHL
jgi:hypothetical protein